MEVKLIPLNKYNAVIFNGDNIYKVCKFFESNNFRLLSEEFDGLIHSITLKDIDGRIKDINFEIGFYIWIDEARDIHSADKEYIYSHFAVTMGK